MGILETINDYIDGMNFKKNGKNYIATCPFHEEKTPSFVVYPDKGMFKCYGCDIHGDEEEFIRLLNAYEKPMKIDIKKTHRGFDRIEFEDLYNSKCSIQKSSLADDVAIWLGIDDADPQIMASKIKEGGTGWVKYPIHEDVQFTTRMHLNIDQVKELIPILQKFVDTGEIT